MAEDFSKLSSLQIDALKEIGNIGAGNAATALAQMVNTKIEMNVPRVKILPFEAVAEILGGADRHVVGIFFSVSGPAPLSILFVLPVESAYILTSMLLTQAEGNHEQIELSDMEISAMMEVGNILSTSYLNALSMFTQITFIPSVPALGIDMAGAVLNTVLAQFGEIADHVLVLETSFKKDQQDVVGNFFLLPQPDSLNQLLAALGVSSNA
ncbi:MAG: chemotaxis protein CheC [Syntrophomonadaceae bacterium]